MSYAAAIYSQGYNPLIESEALNQISREQAWRLGTIVNSASSQREIETQLVMDRLLREYLKPKSQWQ
jgi:hypothetical protein